MWKKTNFQVLSFRFYAIKVFPNMPGNKINSVFFIKKILSEKFYCSKCTFSLYIFLIFLTYCEYVGCLLREKKNIEKLLESWSDIKVIHVCITLHENYTNWPNTNVLHVHIHVIHDGTSFSIHVITFITYQT